MDKTLKVLLACKRCRTINVVHVLQTKRAEECLDDSSFESRKRVCWHDREHGNNCHREALK